MSEALAAYLVNSALFMSIDGVVFCQPAALQTHIISFRKANAREQSNFEAGAL